MEKKISGANIDQLSQEFRLVGKRLGVTDDGMNFVLQCIDPFHDTRIDLKGLPDGTVGQSVLFDVRQTFTITKPAAVADQWDCNLTVMPFQAGSEDAKMQRSLLSAVVVGPENLWNAGGFNALQVNADPNIDSRLPASFLVYNAVTAGDPTFISATSTYGRFDLSPFMPTSGSSRLISAAFEVHNTTAELEKQGSVIVYRAENEAERRAYKVINEVNATVREASQLMCASLPPITSEEAQQARGIVDEAKEGCLVPIIIDQDRNPPSRMAGQEGFLYIKSGDNSISWVSPGLSSVVLGNKVGPVFAQCFPLETSGAYFTGLSATTTLTVSVRCVIEHFPYVGTSLFPLARDAPKADSKALELVAEIQSVMLAGYPVHENSAGDFFKRALGVVKSIYNKAMPIAKLVAPALGPRGQALIEGAELVEGVAKTLKSKKKNKGSEPQLKSGGMRMV